MATYVMDPPTLDSIDILIAKLQEDKKILHLKT